MSHISTAVPVGVDGRTPRTLAWTIGLAVWLVYLTSAGGTLGTEDATAMFEAAKSLVARGDTHVPQRESIEAWRGIDGGYYTPFGIGQSLYDVPFLLAGRALTRVTGVRLGDDDTIPKAVVAIASTIPAAVAVSFAFLLAWRLSGNMRASLWTALALAFGTLLWPYAKLGFNASLSAGALTAGIYGIGVGWMLRRPLPLMAGGFALGFALLTRHELVAAGLVSVAWMAVQVRDAARLRLLAAGSLGIVLALATWMALNAARFGHPLWTGHAPAYTGAGLTAFVASPSGALWLYSPVTIAVLAILPGLRRRQPWSLLIAGVLVAMGGFYMLLDDWLGTRSYGPRYLVPLVPLMVAPLALWLRSPSRRARQAVGVLCAMSVIVQLPAIVVEPARAGIAAGQPPQGLRRDDWHWAPLMVNARQAVRAVPANARYFTGLAPLPEVSTARASGSIADRVGFSLDFWWLYLFYLGAVSRAGALLLAVAPLLLAAWLGLVAMRETRHVRSASQLAG